MQSPVDIDEYALADAKRLCRTELNPTNSWRHKCLACDSLNTTYRLKLIEPIKLSPAGGLCPGIPCQWLCVKCLDCDAKFRCEELISMHKWDNWKTYGILS